MSRIISFKPVTHSLEKKKPLSKCESLNCGSVEVTANVKCWYFSPGCALGRMPRTFAHMPPTTQRPYTQGRNQSPSCKQADKDNLIDVGAAHWLKKRHL